METRAPNASAFHAPYGAGPRFLIRIILLAMGANALGYVDRVSISTIAPRLSDDLGFSPVQMGFIFGAFSLSYALFQAPWGSVADKHGTRRMIAVAILAWSAFTGLTAVAWSFLSMIVIRFLFGISEAVISPAIACTFGRIVPAMQRSTCFGFFLAGGRIGGALAPALSVFLTVRFGWRVMFFIFSGAGILLIPVWLFGVPPLVDRFTNTTTMETKSDKPWWSIRLAALLLVSFCYTVSWQFFITWFPGYLVKSRNFTLGEAAGYSSLPLLFGLVSSWMGGLLSDNLASRWGLRISRRALGLTALLLAAALFYSGVFIPNRAAGAVLMSLAAGAGDLNLGPIWALAVDIGGGKAAGTVSGLLNLASNVGAFVSPILIGYVVERSHNWHVALTLTATFDVLAAMFWLVVTGSRYTVARPET